MGDAGEDAQDGAFARSLSFTKKTWQKVDNLNVLLQKLPTLLRNRLDEHQRVLQQKPNVAVLLDDGAVEEIPAIATVRDRASTCWHGQKRTLLILELTDEKRPADDTCNPHGGELYAPWEQVQKLVTAVECGPLAAGRPRDGPFCWPLHSWEVCHEIEIHAAYMYELEEKTICRPFRWLLEQIFILPRRPGEGVNKLYEHQFGMEVGFDVCWSALHVQSLWALAAICFVLFVFDIRPASEGTAKILFGCGLAAVWIWRAIFVWLHRSAARMFKDDSCYTRNPQWCENESKTGKAKRWGYLFFPGIPFLCCYWALLLFIFSCYTQLVLTVTYGWGRCIERMEERPDVICRDPQMEHGTAGLIVEISCDVGLVILFEICCAIGNALAQFLSGLMNFKWEEDRKLFELKFVTTLATIERLAFVAILALIWSPRWQDPVVVEDWAGEPGWEVDTSIDCSDTRLGDLSMECMQRRIGVMGRRFLFEKLMKGPFVVAPFIAILMKVIVPMLVNTMVYTSRKYLSSWKILSCGRGFWRLAALIFSFHGGNVGGLKFVYYGWPYSTHVRLEPLPVSAAAKHGSAARPGSTVPDAGTQLEEVPLRVAADPAPGEQRGDVSAKDPAVVPISECPELQKIPESLNVDQDTPVPMSELPDLPEFPESMKWDPQREPTLPNVPDDTEVCTEPLDKAPIFALPSHMPTMPSSSKSQDGGCSEIESDSRIEYALIQSVRKYYNPIDELLETKMRKLWLLYFTPIMPWGVGPTLCATILEVYFDIAKLLWTRARPVPSTSRRVLEACCAYDLANLSGALGWYVSLMFLSYNDDLYTWEKWGKITLLGTLFWQWLSYNLPMAFYSNNGGFCAP